MRKKIFIADDEKDIVEILFEQIRDQFPDCHIDFAFDGEESLKKLNLQKYDILITDLNMPKLEGNDLIRSLGEENKKFYPTKIIVISGYINLQHENTIIENIHFIQKPFAISEIIQIIRDC
jgi:YesN/AraC family two-component response regulator